MVCLKSWTLYQETRQGPEMAHFSFMTPEQAAWSRAASSLSGLESLKIHWALQLPLKERHYENMWYHSATFWHNCVIKQSHYRMWLSTQCKKPGGRDSSHFLTNRCANEHNSFLYLFVCLFLTFPGLGS